MSKHEDRKQQVRPNGFYSVYLVGCLHTEADWAGLKKEKIAQGVGGDKMRKKMSGEDFQISYQKNMRKGNTGSLLLNNAYEFS